jgi:alcohol/geraniol dehydrogenase (NADP+)
LIEALRPKGRLHNVGLVPKPLEVPAFNLILGQKSVSGSPTASPAVIDEMLEFCGRHSIAPITEIFPMSKINDAFERLRSGQARYRIVLANDLA